MMAADSPEQNGSPTATAVGDVVEAGASGPLTPCFASVHPGEDQALAPEFAAACERLKKALGMPVWLLIQNAYPEPPNQPGPLDNLGPAVRDAFFRCRQQLAVDGPVALVVDSPGGYARSAYEIARMLQRHCGNFTAIVPRYAKSAATLLVLGAPIMLAPDAELGPLDAQVWDAEREEQTSALNEVQALERLHLQAVEEVDQMTPLLVGRTGKKVATLLPLVLDFVASMKRPLLDKLDTVHYTQQSRTLKEAEEYAVRLLRASGLYEAPRVVAARLVNQYPDHGFVIDPEEAGEFLHLVEPPKAAASAIEELANHLTTNEVVAIGRFNGA